LVSGPLTGSDREAWIYQKEKLLAVVHNAEELTEWWIKCTLNTEEYNERMQAQLAKNCGATKRIFREINTIF